MPYSMRFFCNKFGISTAARRNAGGRVGYPCRAVSRVGRRICALGARLRRSGADSRSAVRRTGRRAMTTTRVDNLCWQPVSADNLCRPAGYDDNSCWPPVSAGGPCRRYPVSGAGYTSAARVLGAKLRRGATSVAAVYLYIFRLFSSAAYARALRRCSEYVAAKLWCPSNVGRAQKYI